MLCRYSTGSIVPGLSGAFLSNLPNIHPYLPNFTTQPDLTVYVPQWTVEFSYYGTATRGLSTEKRTAQIERPKLS